MQVDCLHRYVPKKFLNLTPTPKIALKGPKRAKKAPKMAEVKAKR